MAVTLGSLVLHVENLERAAAFWQQALGFVVLTDTESNLFCVVSR